MGTANSAGSKKAEWTGLSRRAAAKVSTKLYQPAYGSSRGTRLCYTSALLHWPSDSKMSRTCQPRADRLGPSCFEIQEGRPQLPFVHFNRAFGAVSRDSFRRDQARWSLTPLRGSPSALATAPLPAPRSLIFGYNALSWVRSDRRKRQTQRQVSRNGEAEGSCQQEILTSGCGT